MAGRPPDERFWEKVDKSQDCWIWTAGQTSAGYGHWMIGRKNWKAHRYAWFLEHGSVPPELDHRCRTRLCVRPSHLEPVTHAENMARMVPADRLKTSCPRGHSYDVKDSAGKRRCSTCEKAQARARYLAKRDTLLPALHEQRRRKAG